MPLWVWITIGVASFLTLSLLVGLAFAAILGTISREVSDLVDLEPWASSPLTRSEGVAADVSAEDSPAEASAERVGSAKSRR